jgi:hypothetical protein
MDHSATKAPRVSRRGFMRLTGLGAGAVAAASSALASEQVPASTAAPQDKPSAGYRETEHVKAYYAHARM